jgi:hypothetical protein
MSTGQSWRSIPDVLTTLRSKPIPGFGVLSAYINISPARTVDQAYLIAFRAKCQVVRDTLDPTERAAFEEAVDQSERFLRNDFVPSSPGLGIFASGREDYFHVVPLQASIADDVRWNRRPILTPIEEELDEYERVAVALIDKERARLYTIFLGNLEERRVFADEVSGKHGSGGWAALAQSRAARHHEEQVRDHVQHVIRELMDMLREHSFDRLIVGGPAEARAMLIHRLPRSLRGRLAGTLNLELFASDDDVLQAARHEIERIERREELAAVRDLVEAAATQHVALGIEPTLDALNDRRVHRLFISTSLSVAGGSCARCGALTVGPGDVRCPTCGEWVSPDSSPIGQIIERAREQGARLEMVSGDAATLLEKHGGMGAWTRY